MADTTVRLLTVGHGTAGKAEFGDLLAAAGIQSLVDVRIAPGSRKFPHFGKDLLAQWLPAAGVAYRWEKRLGGFRKLPPDWPDGALRNDSFRAYAAYMRTSDFSHALRAPDTAPVGPPIIAARCCAPVRLSATRRSASWQAPDPWR